MWAEIRIDEKDMAMTWDYDGDLGDGNDTRTKLGFGAM